MGMTSKSLPFILVAVLALSGTALRADPAPNWDLKDLSGKSVKLSDFKGKVVVLDFWATWCPPCRAEIPDFIDLQKQYQSKGFTVVGVSIDQGGTAAVAPFVKSHNINYPIVMGDESVVHQYGDVEAIPTTFIIDPKGNIAGMHQGQTPKSVFEAEIKKLLPAATVAAK